MSINSQTANRAYAITPDDDVDNCQGVVYVGVTGDVKVTTEGGDDALYKNFVQGGILPVRVRRVWSTGTTATNLVANYQQ